MICDKTNHAEHHPNSTSVESVEAKIVPEISTDHEEICFLVICNIAKKNNLATLINTALAHRFMPIVVGLSGMLRELKNIEESSYLRMENLVEVKVCTIPCNRTSQSCSTASH